MSLSEFLEMDGYGAYIWSCYGLTLAVLIANVWVARRQLLDQLLLARRRIQSTSGDAP